MIHNTVKDICGIGVVINLISCVFCILHMFMTYSTSYCYFIKLFDPWNMCVYARMCVFCLYGMFHQGF
jgi:hypothetical protein